MTGEHRPAGTRIECGLQLPVNDLNHLCGWKMVQPFSKGLHCDFSYGLFVFLISVYPSICFFQLWTKKDGPGFREY